MIKVLAEKVALHLVHRPVTVRTQPPFIRPFGQGTRPMIDLVPGKTDPELLRVFCLACAHLREQTDAEAEKVSAEWLAYANEHAQLYQWVGVSNLETRLKVLATWPWLSR